MNKEKRFLKIIGNRPVNGVIKTSGSKNAALPLIAASLLIKGEVILNNVPRIDDVFKMLEILEYLNVKYTFTENTLSINSSNMIRKDLLIKQVSQIRGSYYLLGPLMEENSSLRFTNVGGCSFSSRPINYHINLFKYAGVLVIKEQNEYVFQVREYRDFTFEFGNKSVGATINAILLGVKFGRKIIIKNYSNEPEVMCLISFLEKAGMNFNINEESISFCRKTSLNQLTFEVIPDRIEAETFALIGLGLGKIAIFDFIKEHHLSFLNFLDRLKAIYQLEDNCLIIEKYIPDESFNLTLKEYPSLSTDIGPILLSYLLLGEKMYLFEDRIYPERLSKMHFFSSTFCFSNNQLLVNPRRLEARNRTFYGTNLRDTMAYLYYCLTHDGEFELYGLEHLFRGYEDIIDKLISLNCKVELLDEESD